MNSILNTVRFSPRRFTNQRPPSGNSKTNQAFSVQASEITTMYAQLLSSVLDGALSARTPLCNCAITFYWCYGPEV